MKFTDEQWREIYEAQARLEAYKLKVQPYPSEDIPDAVTASIAPEVIVPVFRPRPVDKELDQLKAQVNYLTNKIAELRAEKSQKRKPKSSYKGLIIEPAKGH